MKLPNNSNNIDDLEPESPPTEVDFQAVQEETYEKTNQAIVEIATLVPLEHRERVVALMSQTVSRVTHHSGPLPRPSDLAAYDGIKRGFAERIMRMSEKEQDYRHDFNSRLLTVDYGLKGRGQNYALISLLVLAGFAVYLAHLGAPIAAAGVATIAILGIVGVFVTGRMIDNKAKNPDKEY